MRLLNARTRQLESFDETSTPPYAILSHTWGADEVSFQDIQTAGAALKEGYAKIEFACEEAIRRNLGHVWVDTCCIDKTSSSEFSEAINSMFLWYANAQECYVYMADVPSGLPLDTTAFQNSRWFTRGWTLQELLAPQHVYFFSQDGNLLGTKTSLGDDISSITKIDKSYLLDNLEIQSASISCRMSWASSRNTTRTEDLAYCLLGIFAINMPLLYGEGSKAFIRLQEEILKVSTDQTVFAWEDDEDNSVQLLSPLAKSSACFRNTGHFIPDDLGMLQDHYFMTHKGLNISLPLTDGGLAVLACRLAQEMFTLIAIPTCAMGSNSFGRYNTPLEHVHRDLVNHLPLKNVNFYCRRHLDNSRFPDPNQVLRDLVAKTGQTASVIIRKLPQETEAESLVVLPEGAWNPITRTITFLPTTENAEELSYRVVSIFLRNSEHWCIHLCGQRAGDEPYSPRILGWRREDSPHLPSEEFMDLAVGFDDPDFVDPKSAPIKASLGRLSYSRSSVGLFMLLDIEEVGLEGASVIGLPERPHVQIPPGVLV